MAFQQQVLKQCTKILHEIECEKTEDDPMDLEQFEELLRRRYDRYRQQKESEQKEVFQFHEFVALCSITADREDPTPFLFKYTKLSFTIMCSHCDSRREPIINLSAFEKWATKLHPLATPRNYKRVFLALASDPNPERNPKSNASPSEAVGNRLGIGVLRQRVTEYAQSSAKVKASESRSIGDEFSRSVYGGITMSRFCGFVEAVGHQLTIGQRECQGMESLVTATERILFHIRGVSDMTGLPPYYGFVVLSDRRVVFQGTALTTKTTAIPLDDPQLSVERVKIGGFLKRDTALKVVSAQGTMSWNVVNMKSARRDDLFWSIWTMIKAHELAAQSASILSERNVVANEERQSILRRRIIVEAAEDVLRQNALQSLRAKEGTDGVFGALAFVRFATAQQQRDAVVAMEGELRSIEQQMATAQRPKWSLFRGLRGNKQRADTGGSLSAVDPVDALEMRKWTALNIETERENKAKALAEASTAERVEFDAMAFLNHLKVLRVELEPVVFGYHLFRCIVEWRNPALSVLVLLALWAMAYFDAVHHFPALLLIANAVLLVALKRDSEGTLLRLNGALLFAGFDADHFEREKIAAEKHADSKYGKIDGDKKGKWSMDIMRRIKMARRNFEVTRFSMGFHQKKLADFSIFLGRFRTIYKWRDEGKSQIFTLLSLSGGIALWFFSLRSVFAVAVAALFWKHNPWRSERARESKGVVDRYFEGIEPDIPAVDSDDDTDSDSDHDGGGGGGVNGNGNGNGSATVPPQHGEHRREREQGQHRRRRLSNPSTKEMDAIVGNM